MKVSIIVVTFNSAATIEETLESLQDQTIDDEHYEILVVDGGSSDGTLQIARSYPVEIHEVPGASIGECRNVGIENAAGEFIAFTDSDCRVPEDWLETHVQRLERSAPSVAGIGGPNTPFESDGPFTKVVGAMQQTFLGSGGSPQSYGVAELRRVESVPACNAVYRRSVFDELRFSGEINVGEDADFNYRLRRRGYELLFDPTNGVDHHLPSDLSEFVDKNYSYGRAMADLQLKRSAVLRWYSLLPSIALLLLPILLIVGRDRGRRLIVGLAASVAPVAYSATAVYRNGHGVTSLLVLVLLPLQYLTYGLGFLHGTARWMKRIVIASPETGSER